MMTVLKAYVYASVYWISLDREAAARNIDPNKDNKAFEHLADTLVHHILSHSILKLDSIIFHYREGKNPDGSDDDDGFFVVAGRGVNKQLLSRLTDEQMVELMEAMGEVLKYPVDVGNPQWYW